MGGLASKKRFLPQKNRCVARGPSKTEIENAIITSIVNIEKDNKNMVLIKLIEKN